MKIITAVAVFRSTPRPPTRSAYARMRFGGSTSPRWGGESHMEKTSVQEAVSGRMRRTHPAAVLVSILVRSRSDSGTWHRYPSTALDQASDATPEFPYAIPLPRWGRWVQRLRAKVGE